MEVANQNYQIITKQPQQCINEFSKGQQVSTEYLDMKNDIVYYVEMDIKY